MWGKKQDSAEELFHIWEGKKDCTGADPGSIKNLKWQLKLSALWHCDKGRQGSCLCSLAEAWAGGRDPAGMSAALKDSSNTITKSSETKHHIHKGISNNSRREAPCQGKLRPKAFVPKQHLLLFLIAALKKRHTGKSKNSFLLIILFCGFVLFWFVSLCLFE